MNIGFQSVRPLAG